jgi:hypothetical protein
MTEIKMDIEGARERLKDFAGQFDIGDVIDEKSGLTANDLLAILITLGQASWNYEDGEPDRGLPLEIFMTSESGDGGD